MAAIDSLLKLLDSQGADELIVIANDIPVLIKAGVERKLTMPAISSELVAAFALEVIGPERAGDLVDVQTIKGVYRIDGGLNFDYEIDQNEQRHRLKLRPQNVTSSNIERESSPEDPIVPNAQSDKGRESSVTSAVLSGEQETPLNAAAIEYVRNTGEPKPSPSELHTCIARALNDGASDIFFSAGDHPRVRVRGEIEVLHGLITNEKHLLGLAGTALTDERSRTLFKTGSVDLAVELNIRGVNRRFRVSLFRHQNGLAAALRPIAIGAPSLEELNLPDSLHELCSYPNGLVLLTGAAGSGKSTTLAALVEHINRTKARHIITLEDPIEFEHANQRSVIHQREVGRHVESFSIGLRASLRESPDVILLGEMRDLPTIAAALSAAETGHLVLSTLHTGDVTSAIDRIIDVFPGHQQPQVRHQLASVLRAIVTQILIPSTRPPGRVPAIERLVVTKGVACQIRDGRSHQITGLIQAGGADGMVTLERSLASLVRCGRVTLDTALCHAKDEPGLKKLVGGKN